MTDEKETFDGIGILLLGLAAMLLVGLAVTGFITAPKPVDDSTVQQSMAWASWAMVVVSIIAGAIGGVSLYLIYRTLQAAQRSAVAAERSLAQFEADAKTSRELSMAQYRAYMTVTEITLQEDAYDFRNTWFKWTVFNSGQSPARTVKLNIQFFTRTRSDQAWEEGERNDKHYFMADIPASAGKPLDEWIYLDFADEEQFESGYQIEVEGSIEFSDIFGRRQSDVFAFRATWEDGESWKSDIIMARRPETTSG